MPVVIILGILLVWFVIDVYEIIATNHHAFTSEELKQMGAEMCGKSESECVKILKKYERR